MLPTRIDLPLSLLRPWRPSDRASLIRHVNDNAVARNLRRVPYPYTEADADWWLGVVATDPPKAGVWAIEVDGEAVGAIGLERGADIEAYSFEIGYWLGRAYWGRGIVTEALRAVTAAVLAEPDIARIYAPVFSWNPASMRVLEKAGYTRECVHVRGGVKEDTLIDRVIYTITRDVGLPYVPFVPKPEA